MGEPATTAGGWLAAKIIPPLLGFIGSALMLIFTHELNPRRMLVAVLFGVVAAYLAPPIAISALRHYLEIDWLPADGSVEGLLGLLIGLASINLVSAWLRFSKDPRAVIAEAKGDADAR